MMFLNLLRGMLTSMAATDAASDGSADNGETAPGNAEEQLSGAFGADAGAEGKKTEGQTRKGEKDKGEKDTGSEFKPHPWMEQLPSDMRGNADVMARLAKYGRIGDMAKEVLELEGKIASGGVPGKDATAEETAAFWEKAGRPKTADGYSFAKDKEREGGAFAELAFNANLTAAQADAVFKSMNELGEKRLQAAAVAREKQLNETARALETEYGSKYKEKMALLEKGLRNAGPNVGALLRQAGLAGNPEIVRAFIAFGEMTAESGSTRGGPAGNSFVPTSEGGTLYD